VPKGDAARDAARDVARLVGAELRRLGELLATRDAPAEVLERVAAELRAVAAQLEEQRGRPRWYELDAGGPDAARELSRAYHDELGPLRGEANPIAPPLRFEPATRPDGSPDGAPAVGARARLGPLHEGPPGRVHGGWLAALFDEVLAVVQRDAAINVVTARLSVRYRRPAPVGAELVFVGWIDDDGDRRVVARATCHAEGELVAEAEAEFVRI
jgi:acyl-coenzyme A thioesterase PaaI-like protein